MAKRFRNHNPNQYVLVFLFLFPILPRSWIMSCVGSLRYRLKLKMQIAYVKILLTRKMIQHSKSMQKKRTETQFQTKKSTLSISTTLSGVISHARLFVTGQLRNPWQTNPWVPRNAGWKNTGIEIHLEYKDCHGDWLACDKERYSGVSIFPSPWSKFPPNSRWGAAGVDGVGNSERVSLSLAD